MTTEGNQKKSQTSGKDEGQKEKGFFNRPRAGGKSMWDWLNLLGILAIPLVVLGATLLFGIQQANLAQQQHENDQKIANQQHEADKQSALDLQEATILQTYIDNIQELLLNHNLLKAKLTDDVAILARARTLTALHGLDAQRKATVVQFLHESQLIGYYDSSNGFKHPSIFSLSEADLRGADLTGSDLRGADLTGSDLRGANLTGADLTGADLLLTQLRSVQLTGANLSGAHLSGASLTNAHLSGSTLTNADLSDVDLSGADLSGANNITQQQIDQVYSCKNVILPPGLTCHHNQ